MAGFPKRVRLLRPSEFRKVYDNGFRHSGPFFAAFCLAGTGPCPRVGLTTPRAVGNSVRRNRLKRRVREVVRARLAELTAPWDIVINPRRPVATCPLPELDREIEKLFRRCNQSASPLSVDTKS